MPGGRDGDPVDLTRSGSVTSSGVMWSQPVKDRLLAHAQAVGSALACFDALGSSEGVGFAGKQSSSGGSDTETAKFELGPNAAVFTPDGRRVEPGSDEQGQLAVGGPIPLGYYGDPVKSAETFREIEGRRWSIPGDWATVADDGTITLLGRGSVSINTGGEKVFPEEIEEELKLLDAVNDVNVVGVPDPKWGSAVTAVVEIADGADVSDDELVDALRSRLSGYKLPKHIVRVDQLYRSPNGKADYKWAVGDRPRRTRHHRLTSGPAVAGPSVDGLPGRGPRAGESERQTGVVLQPFGDVQLADVRAVSVDRRRLNTPRAASVIGKAVPTASLSSPSRPRSLRHSASVKLGS